MIALQANGIDRADTAGCNGCGWRENACYTLNTIDRHAVCYGIDQQGGKGMAGYTEDVAPTMCSDSHGTPHAVCYGIGNGQANQAALDDNVGALNCMHDQQAVCYPQTTGTLCASGAGLNRPAGQCNETDLCVVQKSKPPRRYIIRRLMPVECARLQGFPDAHGDLAPYDGDDAFWEGVRKTHAEINGKKYKPLKNINIWYEKLHNDGAEYKMWGNGICLPCAEYVLRGIADER